MAGHCFYSTFYGERYPGMQEWEGMQEAEQGDCIGMLLDLDQGSMTVYKGDVQLGVMVPEGLSGPLCCWATAMYDEGDGVRIESAPLPAQPAAKSVCRMFIIYVRIMPGKRHQLGGEAGHEAAGIASRCTRTRTAHASTRCQCRPNKPHTCHCGYGTPSLRAISFSFASERCFVCYPPQSLPLHAPLFLKPREHQWDRPGWVSAHSLVGRI